MRGCENGPDYDSHNFLSQNDNYSIRGRVSHYLFAMAQLGKQSEPCVLVRPSGEIN